MNARPAVLSAQRPWWAQYIGLRFDDDNANGVHCWGLVRKVYREQRGVELPAYSEYSADDLVAMAAAVASETGPHGQFNIIVPRGSEREFDVAVMLGRVEYPGGVFKREPTHVGVMIGSTHVLHVERASAAVIVPLSHVTIRFRYLCAWRLREAA